MPHTSTKTNSKDPAATGRSDADLRQLSGHLYVEQRAAEEMSFPAAAQTKQLAIINQRIDHAGSDTWTWMVASLKHCKEQQGLCETRSHTSLNPRLSNKSQTNFHKVRRSAFYAGISECTEKIKTKKRVK